MALYSTSPAGERTNIDSSSTNAQPRKGNGRFWSRSGVNDSSTERSFFSLRSMFAPTTSSSNMSATKELPQPASPIPPPGFTPTSDYADKVFRRFHHHTISDSTGTFGSNDSSPTTTCSTVDDSSATEPSPGSSPESPPPNSFVSSMLRPRTSDEATSPFFELQRAAPPKKGRNLKGLAVNTSRMNGKAASTPSLPLQIQKPTEPEPSIMSPSFVKPPTPPKRKPSNLGLTILTPASTNPLPQPIKLAIPPTPGFGRPATLRHFQSSPSLPLFPHNITEVVLPSKLSYATTLETIISPTEPPQIQAKVDDEQNFDIPLSREEKPEAYPDGPICVYDPYIDLYLEPTADQARKYDVVMNVASEVRNPLLVHDKPAPAEPEMRLDGGGGIQFAPKRDMLYNETRQPSSPSTPKATPLHATFPKSISESIKPEPEYIHIPWEHNSDIVPDLLRLVKLMDEKVKQHKKVLVHCQCGVSRSASLVVAYGLYKNPSMSVQEAYDAVKQKSKWIGPNMNLIMQLQEFRSSLARGGRLPDNRGMSPITPSSAMGDWPGPFSSRVLHNGPLSAGMASTARSPTTASLPALSPGPSSAPSGMPWPKEQPTTEQRPRELSTVRTSSSAYVDPSGHVIPVLNVVEPERPETKTTLVLAPIPMDKEDETATPTRSISSPRAAEFAMTPLKPSTEIDSADSFGLMSPTATEFTSSPFDRPSLLAQLGMGSMRQQDDLPLRTKSLRSRPSPQASDNTQGGSLATPARKLRGKISSPSIREQKELQRLQAEIEAKLHFQQHPVLDNSNNGFPRMDDALMSPRATEFTQNPFASLTPLPELSTAPEEAPRTSVADPRSPAQAGIAPITRNLEDYL